MSEDKNTYIKTMLIDNDERHGLCEKTTGVANVDGSFLFVSSQHPDLHVSLAEVGDALRHFLQKISSMC